MKVIQRGAQRVVAPLRPGRRPSSSARIEGAAKIGPKDAVGDRHEARRAESPGRKPRRCRGSAADGGPGGRTAGGADQALCERRCLCGFFQANLGHTPTTPGGRRSSNDRHGDFHPSMTPTTKKTAEGTATSCSTARLLISAISASAKTRDDSRRIPRPVTEPKGK